jgi:hypothetical protein
MRDLLLLTYAVAVGFVAAGIAASFYKMVTSEPAKFRLLGESAFGWVTTFVFCALTGPVIVVETAIRNRRTERLPFAWVIAGIAVAGLWSCCVGIIVLEVVLSLRDSLA